MLNLLRLIVAREDILACCFGVDEAPRCLQLLRFVLELLPLLAMSTQAFEVGAEFELLQLACFIGAIHVNLCLSHIPAGCGRRSGAQWKSHWQPGDQSIPNDPCLQSSSLGGCPIWGSMSPGNYVEILCHDVRATVLHDVVKNRPKCL